MIVCHERRRLDLRAVHAVRRRRPAAAGGRHRARRRGDVSVPGGPLPGVRVRLRDAARHGRGLRQPGRRRGAAADDIT